MNTSIFLLLALLLSTAAHAQSWQVSSPNGRVQIDVSRSDAGLPRYSVTLDGHPVIVPSALGVNTDVADFGAQGFAAPEITWREADVHNPHAARIVQGNADFNTPWRVIALGDSPRALLESTLLPTLGAPSRVA